MSSYLYDANGNATTDGRSGNIITYNRLNLPSGVTALNLSYVYDAAGNKLKKKSGAKVTDYISGIQYTDGALELIQTGAGVARKNGSVYSYEYNLSDHLGNVRYTFYKNPVGGSIERLQSDDYYPFGLRKLVQEGTNKYLYNGKELQEELGQYDYGARFYDPVIGRWNVIDPLSEKGRRWSPYVYGFNNPIRFTDPDGMWPDGPGDPPYDDLSDPLGNGMSLVENLYWGTRDKVSSALVTVGSYIGSLFSDDVSTKKITYSYGENGRTGKLENVTGNKHVAAAWGVVDIAAVIPGEGTAANMLLSKTVGGKSTAADLVKDIAKTESSGKYTISEVKEALTKVHGEVGSLPKGSTGKFGSPQRGTSKKGYRLDSEGHPNTTNPAEKGPHINWWDYSNGKKNSGGRWGAFSIGGN